MKSLFRRDPLTDFVKECEAYWKAEEIAAYNENKTRIELPHAKPTKQTRTLDGNGQRKTPGAKRPIVRFGLCRARLLDVDAKYGSIKDLLDGLAYAGLIHGDREDQITLEVYQIKVAHIKDEQTIIEIEY